MYFQPHISTPCIDLLQTHFVWNKFCDFVKLWIHFVMFCCYFASFIEDKNKSEKLHHQMNIIKYYKYYENT